MKKHFYLILFCCVTTAFAHEQWLLSPSETAFLNAEHSPQIFRELNIINGTLILGAVLFIVSWIFIHLRYAQQISKINRYLTPYQFLSNYFLRYGTAMMLIICALNLIPRVGTHIFGGPNLLAPDLELDSLNNYWHWLMWIELIIAGFFICGIYVRLAAMTLGAIALLSVYLFGEPSLQYLGFYLGIALYLGLEDIKKITIKHRTFLLQILTGLSFIHSGVSYKLLKPNLDIALLIKNHTFTFGIPYVYFVLIMTLVEIGSGLLVVSGYGLRLLSLILFGLFIFLSIVLAENPLVHSFIFGILFTFMINGGVPIHLYKNRYRI